MFEKTKQNKNELAKQNPDTKGNGNMYHQNRTVIKINPVPKDIMVLFINNSFKQL